jgi:hypothetical protein
MRDPNDSRPDPPGGRAAERLKEFLRKRGLPEPPSREIEERPEKQQEEGQSAEGEES